MEITKLERRYTMSTLKKRLTSDVAASNSVETILLIAMAVFAVLAIFNYIMKPLMKSTKDIGGAIEDMGPN